MRLRRPSTAGARAPRRAGGGNPLRGQDFPQRHARARADRSHDCRRRIPHADRPVRLRQEHAAQAHRQPDRADRRTDPVVVGRVRQSGHARPLARLRLPGSDPDAMGARRGQRPPAARSRGRAEKDEPRARRAGAGARRPRRLRARTIRGNCPAACGCGCRSRAAWSPSPTSC